MLVYLKEFLLISMIEFDNRSSEAKTFASYSDFAFHFSLLIWRNTESVFVKVR